MLKQWLLGSSRNKFTPDKYILPHSVHYYSHAQYRKRVNSQPVLVNQMSTCTILASAKEVFCVKKAYFCEHLSFLAEISSSRYARDKIFLNFS